MAQGIETRLVCGFLDAGKTTHIQSCIVNDFFHKYGTTLILAFESGETEYDEDTLLRYRTYVAYWEEGEDVTAFCLRQLEEWQPDRVYVEMNAMREGLRDRLPPALRVSAVSVLIDTKTLALYLNAFRALFLEMVRGAHTVVSRLFRPGAARAIRAGVPAHEPAGGVPAAGPHGLPRAGL